MNNFKGCGGEVYNVNGVVTSPTYPIAYTQVSDCRWNLKVPEGHLIAIKFNGKLNQLTFQSSRFLKF